MYNFRNPELFQLALTHRSCGPGPRNEQLEFLGDSVLGVIITDYLYRIHSSRPEGFLAQTKASLVNTDKLYEVARRMDLGSHIKLGRNEELDGGRQKKNILADAVEAIIGAIYIDGGMEAAREWVFRKWGIHGK